MHMLSPIEIILLVGVLFLLFGTNKLKDLAKGIKDFKKEMNRDDDDDDIDVTPKKKKRKAIAAASDDDDDKTEAEEEVVAKKTG